jgi:hypothetical protein
MGTKSAMGIRNSVLMLLPLAAIAGVCVQACTQEPRAPDISGDSFVRERTARGRLLEATSIVKARIKDSVALVFEQPGREQGICGYHANVEVAQVLDGKLVGSDIISNEPLRKGEDYVLAVLDMRGRLPESVENPHVGLSDRNFMRCRDQFEQYSLGSARIVATAGSDKVEVAVSDLATQEIHDLATDGTVSLNEFTDVIRRIRRGEED